MTRTGEQAIAAAREQSSDGTRFDVGLCLQRVRLCYAVPARDSDAATAWMRADHRHPTTDPAAIPRGVPVFWTGGAHGYGHVAISTGGGECWSTDILRRGRWDKVPIRLIGSAWGLRLVGWTEDLNGVRVYAGNGKEEDMSWTEELEAWYPGDPDTKDTMPAGQQLNQARGFAREAYRTAKRTERAIEALAKALGPTVETAVREALADAVVDVDVNVHQGGAQ